MDEYLPSELHRHILSYTGIPYMARVDRYFHDIESDLDKERYDRYKNKYSTILDAVRFLLHKKYDTGNRYDLSTYIGKSGMKNLISYYIEPHPLYDYIAYWAAQGGYRELAQWLLSLQ